MNCGITGCPNAPKFIRRDVVLHLPGHPEPVELGDLRLCPEHNRTVKRGRASIRSDVITAALMRR